MAVSPVEGQPWRDLQCRRQRAVLVPGMKAYAGEQMGTYLAALIETTKRAGKRGEQSLPAS